MSAIRPSVLEVVLRQSERVLETYRIDKGLIQEHANNERRIKEGGYGDRQIYELVQNGADELRGDPGGKIAVVLTTTCLYCANEGVPMSPEGADTILRMGVSRKRGGQIGRFGVGVKSVLGVTDMPEFFSREHDMSFGFDREWAAGRIREVQPGVDETPVLRMARPLDRDRAIAEDPILAELLAWATTVVRLPLKPASVSRLAKDLREFPTEFPLFSPHVKAVVLEDRRSKSALVRQVSQQVEGDRRLLKVDNAGGASSTEQWRVFTRTHRPSLAALEEAGELHDRPEIDVSWAVPVREGRANRVGRFWAYFPTNYAMTLRGIVNAPWKTSEDRQNLYDGNAFNDELIQVMADLVVDSMPKLSTPADPCAHLDSAPARGREEPQWAAHDLVKAIWRVAARKPILPDQNGVIRTVEEVRLHPEKLQPDWLAWWAGYPGRPTNWCHHSVEAKPHRRQSAERVLEDSPVAVASIQEWLEALVEDRSPEASAIAIMIAADMKSRRDPRADEAGRARIVLTDSLGLVAPSTRVFRRSSDDGLADGTVYVDERVHVEDAVARALDILGVHEADYAGRFASVVEQGFQGYDDAMWASFWELSRLAGPADVLKAFEKSGTDTGTELRVRTLKGEFRRVRDCLLPGRVVPADGSRDAGICVDMSFHREDRHVLRDLGLLDGPVARVDPRGEAWFAEYKTSRWQRYCEGLTAAEHRPQESTMRFDGSSPAGPLHFLTELSPEGSAAFLKELPADGLVAHWTMQVGRQSKTRQVIMSPLQWVVRKHGYLQTSRGLRRVPRCVGPTLEEFADVLPVANVGLNIAEMMRLPATLQELRPSLWAELTKEAAESRDDAFPGKVYAALFEAGAAWPEEATTRCRVGDEWRNDVADAEIAVTSRRAEYDALVRERVPALLAPTDEAVEQMREVWGMRSPADVIQKEVRWTGAVEPVLLTDEFPHLKVFNRAAVEGWSLLRCTELDEITRTPHGMRTAPVRAAVQQEERLVLVLDPADDLATLIEVDRMLKLNLGTQGCKAVLERREKQRNNERLRRVRAAQGPARKALELIGADALKNGLPEGLLESEEAEKGQSVDDERIAELAHNAYGSDIFRNFRKQIETELPEAAVSFRGDTNSLRFINEIDLPESYAGAKSETLPPVELVAGPTAFPRLHDYQEKLAGKMFDLLVRYSAPRAMLCLPTGAGKTRVAAEAVIRVIKERGLDGRPVLWIAQTEELCEQAVQSWSFVWSKVGPDEQLTINRLWSTREAAAVKESVHLVVATDAKLESCLDKDEYSWLRNAALVIIDEAHASITPRYTKLLASLGITHRESARPLIGLTATPFRGFNVEETRRLVERYGGTRLDEGIFGDDPYSELQELGVLAKVGHRQLAGATIELTADELQQTTGFQGARLPSSAEKRLAGDMGRNRMLIKTIESLPQDSPVLLFATSVNHARLIAAMLNDRRIQAESIDSSTPDADRRARIERFRRKKTRVLTNYGVLAQGFDAPATEVVIVARPTYSPNVYQQMIGRGLRGPRNGGKETCLILDVADNITNFHKKLAFTEFEYLWSRT